MSQNLRSQAQKVKPKVLSDFEHKCYVCEYSCTPILVIHHITPISEGGDSSLNNLVVLCPNCHALVHKIIGVLDRNDDINLEAMSNDLQVISDWMTNNLNTDSESRLNSITKGRK